MNIQLKTLVKIKEKALNKKDGIYSYAECNYFVKDRKVIAYICGFVIYELVCGFSVIRSENASFVDFKNFIKQIKKEQSDE